VGDEEKCEIRLEWDGTFPQLNCWEERDLLTPRLYAWNTNQPANISFHLTACNSIYSRLVQFVFLFRRKTHFK
jgi:hypothetical protein